MALSRNHSAVATQTCVLCVCVFADSLRAECCSQAVSKPVWHMPLLCVLWKTPDNGQRNCPKHAEFYSKNKFEKSLHLMGFIIWIYHDARSPERQENVSLILAFRRRVWLNRSYRQTSRCAVSQFLLSVAVQRIARSDKINHLWYKQTPWP